MTYSVRIDDTELRRKWDAAERNIPSVMAKTMGEAVLYVHSQVPGYPEPPAASTYRRTGTLGRSITTEVKKLGADTVGLIGTAVVYAPWVIDEARQAGVHQGRWYTLQKVVSGAIDKVAGMFERAFTELLR